MAKNDSWSMRTYTVQEIAGDDIQDRQLERSTYSVSVQGLTVVYKGSCSLLNAVDGRDFAP